MPKATSDGADTGKAGGSNKDTYNLCAIKDTS